MGPMARTVADLARLMDVMAGYDSEDPETALGVGHKAESYLAALKKDALRGSRIGVLRTDLGTNSDPGSQDYKNVMDVFSRAVGGTAGCRSDHSRSRRYPRFDRTATDWHGSSRG